MLTFRNTTLVFFILLFLLNLLGLSGMPVHLWYYILLVSVYMGISVFLSFFIGSGYHMKAYCRAATDKKVVSLTFDDGPDNQLTPLFLDELKKLGIPATFFCIGRKITGNEDLLKRMNAEGHLIGTHSYTHSNWFDLFSPGHMRRELLDSRQSVSAVIGRNPRFFRPPYGVINPMLKRALNGSGLHVIGFSNRAWDTSSRNTEIILSRILKKLKPGDIILLHDTIPESAEVLKKIHEQITSSGYRIVPLDQLLNLSPYEA
jgi:peptidoglycan-N-acetylglucosamine deacetylase